MFLQLLSLRSFSMFNIFKIFQLLYMYTILKMAYVSPQRLPEQPRLCLCFPEMDLSPSSPYTCTSARPLRYGW